MLIPLNKYVVLQRVQEKTKTPSGIILTNTKESDGNIGLVLALSTDLTDIKVEDKVIFMPEKVVEVDYQGAVLLLVKADALLAIME